MEAGTSEVEIPETSNVDLAKDEPKERDTYENTKGGGCLISTRKITFLHSHDLRNAGISQGMFWEFHPKQSTQDIPFNGNLVYFRKGIQGANINDGLLSTTKRRPYTVPVA